MKEFVEVNPIVFMNIFMFTINQMDHCAVFVREENGEPFLYKRYSHSFELNLSDYAQYINRKDFRLTIYQDNLRVLCKLHIAGMQMVSRSIVRIPKSAYFFVMERFMLMAFSTRTLKLLRDSAHCYKDGEKYVFATFKRDFTDNPIKLEFNEKTQKFAKILKINFDIEYDKERCEIHTHRLYVNLKDIALLW